MTKHADLFPRLIASHASFYPCRSTLWTMFTFHLYMSHICIYERQLLRTPTQPRNTNPPKRKKKNRMKIVHKKLGRIDKKKEGSLISHLYHILSLIIQSLIYYIRVSSCMPSTSKMHRPIPEVFVVSS